MLSYQIFGKGARTIVFLHGFMGDVNSFRGLANGLKGESKVVLVDFGFHGSPFPCSTLDEYVLEICDILNREGVGEAYFVCHSFGGRVGVRLARRFPALLKGLILIDSAGLKPRRSPVYYAKIFTHKLLKRLGKKGLKGSKDFRDLTEEQKRAFISIINDATDGDLAYVTAKTLIIWGKNDKATPLYMAKRYRRKLRFSRLVVLKDAGHFSYLDKKGETLALIRAYISDDDSDSLDIF